LPVVRNRRQIQTLANAYPTLTPQNQARLPLRPPTAYPAYPPLSARHRPPDLLSAFGRVPISLFTLHSSLFPMRASEICVQSTSAAPTMPPVGILGRVRDRTDLPGTLGARLVFAGL